MNAVDDEEDILVAGKLATPLSAEFSKTTAVRRLSYHTMPTSLIVVVGGESVTRVVNPF